MTPDEPNEYDIAAAAGTEDEDGVIQPSLDEILDPDPEHAGIDEDEIDDDAAEA